MNLYTGKKSIIELAWAAGFFDGEGHSSYSLRQGFKAEVNQVNNKVLFRFRRATGLGQIGGPYGPYQKNHSKYWQWRINNRVEVEKLYRKLLPYLSTVKKTQFKSVLRRKDG